MARITTNEKIDYKAISIDVNGLTTSSTNKRKDSGVDANGFVYTVSTKASEDGNSYEYKYQDAYQGKLIEENPITYIEKEQSDFNRNAGAFRDGDDSKFEGIIALKQAVSSTGYNGKATEKNDFLYNEGNIGNVNSSPLTGELEAEYAGEANGNNFYDNNTKRFSDQLTKVRELTNV